MRAADCAGTVGKAITQSSAVATDKSVARAEAIRVMISVIVPVYNSADSLRRCLEAVTASSSPSSECIVVDDGSTDGSQCIARLFPVRVVELSSGPSGPAQARNRGAEVARGKILFFVDADVVIQPGTLTRVEESFERHPEVAALFGSYDDQPAVLDFTSQYKNLSHCFVHQQAREEASTFWSGCGAIRRDVFFEVGGFDEVRYPRPSIEDIELGYHVVNAGYKILLNKEIKVTHLKRWTLRGLLKCDIFDRAIPWTLLSLRERNMPNDLNLHFTQRISALLVCGLLLLLVVATLIYDVLPLLLLAALFLVVIGYWHWSEIPPLFSEMSRRALLFSFLLMGVGTWSAFASENSHTLPFLIALPVGMMLSPQLPNTRRWNYIFFAATVLGFMAAFVLLLLSLPLEVAALLILILFGIVLLNHRFYTFFARKRGFMFALAVVPFQLLYYLYSVSGFALGVGLHFWNTSLKR